MIDEIVFQTHQEHGVEAFYTHPEYALVHTNRVHCTAIYVSNQTLYITLDELPQRIDHDKYGNSIMILSAADALRYPEPYRAIPSINESVTVWGNTEIEVLKEEGN